MGEYLGKQWPERRCKWKIDLPGEQTGKFSCACMPEAVIMFESGGRTCGTCLVEQEISGVVPLPGNFRSYPPVLHIRYTNTVEYTNSVIPVRTQRGLGDTAEIVIRYTILSKIGKKCGLQWLAIKMGIYIIPSRCEGGCIACKKRQAWLNLMFPYSRFVWKHRWRRFIGRLAFWNYFNCFR